VKNVWLRIAQTGSKKIATINFTHRVGTTSGSDAGTPKAFRARATLRTTFRSRLELRLPRVFIDLRFVAAKGIRRLRINQETLKAEKRETRGDADKQGAPDYFFSNCLIA
jgi:hypothetical protein